MRYSLRFQSRALKDLSKIGKPSNEKIVEAIEKLENDLTGDVKKLTAHSPKFRLRVGSFRVLFDIKDDEIVIHRIKDRRDAY